MIETKFYKVKELVQSTVTDFSMEREEPAIFKAGNQFLVALPVRYKEHPDFLGDLSKMLIIYAEIFKKIEFLSIQAMKNKNKVEKMIQHVTVFSNTKQYKHFVTKGLPNFLIRWGMTLNKKQTDFIKIQKRKADKILNEFTIDELLKVFMYIYAFNFDSVKKNNWDLLQRIIPTVSTQSQADSISSGSKRKSLEEILPKFSTQPYSKSDLQRIAQQSTAQ